MKNKKEKRAMLFLLVILVITVGYALLSQQLNINGTAKINKTTWKIIWNNVVVTNGSVTGDQVIQEPTIDTNKTTVEYSINLKQPKEYYEFTIDAKNEGTIDGMIDVISNNIYESDGVTEVNPIPSYLSYTVTYSDGIEVKNNQLLKAGTTETYKVRVKFKDVEASELPSSADRTLKFRFGINYIQADENAEEVRVIETRYTANIFDEDSASVATGTNTSLVWIGKPITNNITMYQTPEEAMLALKTASGGTTDRPFFLKHTLVNGIVTESYVGFVISDEMVSQSENEYITNCNNDQECINSYQGMTAGTYYLKGNGLAELVNGNWQCKSEYYDGEGNCIDPGYNTNKTTLLNAFGNSNCRSRDDQTTCNATDLYAGVSLMGYVIVRDDSLDCGAGVDGFPASSCFNRE